MHRDADEEATHVGASARPAPLGFASLAGALGDMPELDEFLDDVAAARTGPEDRPVPDLD